jgi:hypothetical protein
MMKQMTVGLVALALAGGAFALVPAQAETYSRTTTTTTTTAPAFGYSDGYWTTTHAWHPWPTTTERQTFERTHSSHYYSGMHTRYSHEGWREHDTWWSH